MILSKDCYLSETIVSEFIDYFRATLDGNEKIYLPIQIVDKKTPKNYPRELILTTLEDGFDSYFWDRQDYSENSIKLSEISEEFKNASKNNLTINEAYFFAVKNCLLWGLGRGAAFNANISWADERKSNLFNLIESGRNIINSNNPNIGAFQAEIRMNAGYTKIYSLICDKSIIYDGRVGAALGFLTKNFLLKKYPESSEVPNSLRFPWGKAKGLGRNRNPSFGSLIFPSLNNNSLNHARWNIQANWIIDKALQKTSSAKWVRGSDGLRKIEAALFMVGYDFGRTN
jgi:hypothetical protein